MYEIAVTGIGEVVDELLAENMIVLFGPTVPNELRDICVVHDGKPTDLEIAREGGSVLIGNQEYAVVACGDAANTNMGGLGHMTIVFGGAGELLPGSIRVEPSTHPTIAVGDTICFR